MKRNILLTVLLFCGAMLFAAENTSLLKNGDFSQVVNGNPAGWQCVYPKGAFAVEGEGEERVMTLTKLDPKAACMLVHRGMNLDMTKSYVVSCEVRSEEEGDAMVYAEWRTPIPDGKFRHTSVNAKKIAANEEWTEVAFEIPPRKKESEAPYLVLMVMNGKVQFRHLTLEEKK